MPSCAADVLGRPVVVASHRMGLVEGQLHVVAPEVGFSLPDGLCNAAQTLISRAAGCTLAVEQAVGSYLNQLRLMLCPLRGLSVCSMQPLSPLQEVPDSPAAAAAALLEEEQQQRGGMFSRLLSQLFDQSTWQQDPTWHHGTAGVHLRCIHHSAARCLEL